MDNRASKAEAVSKPKGRHVEVRKDRGTARKAGEIINSIARLIRWGAARVHSPTRLRGCPRRAPGASRGTARENRGAVAGAGRTA